MKITEDIIILPNDLENNASAELYYLGSLPTLKQLFVEYTYLPSTNTTAPINTNKLEMKKIGNSFSVTIPLENTSEFYFRLLDENNAVITSEGKQEFSIFVNNSFEDNISSANKMENIWNNDQTNTSTYTQATVATPVQNKVSEEKKVSDSLAMVPIKEKNLIYARNGLRLSYRLNKKIRLILYKLFRKLPNFITGNYRRRINL